MNLRESNVETIKEAWDILMTTHEATNAVKNSKLQMLTFKFETIRMEDDESFNEFYAKLNDTVNSRFYLGDKVTEPKVIHKVLRSFQGNSMQKVMAIED